jgi:hypothetical protein
MNHRERMRLRLGDGAPRPDPKMEPSAISSPSIEFRIDRLLLEGVPPGDRYRIAEAVQRELTRLLMEHEVPASSPSPAHQVRVDAGTIHITSGMRTTVVGEKIAHAIHGGVGAATNAAGRTERS